MYNMYVRCNYKLTLWFKNKVLNKKHKNIKLSTKIELIYSRAMKRR